MSNQTMNGGNSLSKWKLKGLPQKTANPSSYFSARHEMIPET